MIYKSMVARANPATRPPARRADAEEGVFAAVGVEEVGVAPDPPVGGFTAVGGRGATGAATGAGGGKRQL
jgi:hypothetical protein